MRFVETPIFTPLIRGAHGARKIRWATAGRGMLYAYAKNGQGDLTPAQARLLGQLIREEFK
jgi:hypothetical protein